MRRSLILMGLCACTFLANEGNAILGGFTPDASDHRFDAVCGLIAWTHWQMPCENHSQCAQLGPLCGPGGQACGSGSPTSELQCPNCAACNFTRCSGTLIAPDLVLLTSHCRGSLDTNWGFRFRRKPDGSVGQVNLSLPDDGASSFHHVRVQCFIEVPPEQFGSEPLLLAVLQEPVTHIQPMPVRYATTTELQEDKQLLFVAGWGQDCCNAWTPGTTCTSEFTASYRLKVTQQIVDFHGGNFLNWHDPTDLNPNPAAQGMGLPGDSGGAVLAFDRCHNRLELIAVTYALTQGLRLEAYDANLPAPEFCAADLNQDGVVDGIDLGIMLTNWSNPCHSPGCGGATPCMPDIDCDGVVCGEDLGILLLNWGPCPEHEAICPGESLLGGQEQSSFGDLTLGTPDFTALMEWIGQASYDEIFEWYLNGMPLPMQGE